MIPMAKTFQISNGDMVYDVAGSLKMVLDNTKARQDVKEVLAIEEIEGFGASLISLIGAVGTSDFLQGAIYRQIFGAVNNLIELQRGRQRERRPASELIDSIIMLQVVQDNIDSTKFTFKIELKTVEQQVLELDGVIFPTAVNTTVTLS